MHPLHTYLAARLGERLRRRRVVVWYDPREELTPFVEELPVVDGGEGPLTTVKVGELPTHLARFHGSFFALRAAVEPVVSVETPEPTLIYLAGVVPDRTGSVLMELELGGDRYEPQLRHLARHALQGSHTDAEIDALLARDNLTYEDVVHLLAQGSEASILRVIYGGTRDTDLLAQWLADDRNDGVIEAKEATGELLRLIADRLGLELGAETTLEEARQRVGRYCLVNEFRADLACEPPPVLFGIPAPDSKGQEGRVRAVAERLRERHAAAYPRLADRTEVELGLGGAPLDGADLGSIDTFRFEERRLLGHCAGLIAEGRYEAAMEVVGGRGRSFWVDQEVSRQARWEACRLMAELGERVDAVGPALARMGRDPAAWVGAYTGEGGWFEVDRLYRQLEARVAAMDDTLEGEVEQALQQVRRRYEALLQAMAVGFSEAFVGAGWAISGVLQQTEIYPKVTARQGGRTAYLLVDALRYEMGVELANLLQEGEEVAVRPAVAALPTITSVGMAALLPGASASFSVVEHKGGVAARVEESTMGEVAARMRFLKAQIPGVVEMTLDRLWKLTSPARLRKRIGEAPVVVIRSQEIDQLGESGADLTARQLMDTVVGNIARAVRKLAAAGIDHFVITADHGHQFALEKGEEMRTDPPGGQTVEIHRRCWIGRGGATPPGAVRVSGAELGYDTDLDFIFPPGLAVFRTHGGLSYHHGGISLQELLVPVVTLRMVAEIAPGDGVTHVTLSACPEVVTNRIFVVKLSVDADLVEEEPVTVRVVLLSGGEQVGECGMASDGELDEATGCVRIARGTTATIGLTLLRDEVGGKRCDSLSVVVQDPATDAILAQSKRLSVRLGI